MAREIETGELFGIMFGDGSPMERAPPMHPATGGQWRNVYDAGPTVDPRMFGIRARTWERPAFVWSLGTGYVCDYSHHTPVAYSTVRDRVSYWYAGRVTQGEHETDCPDCYSEHDDGPCRTCEGLEVVPTPALAIVAYESRDMGGRAPRARWVARRWREAREAHERDYPEERW